MAATAILWFYHELCYSGVMHNRVRMTATALPHVREGFDVPDRGAA